MTASEKRKWIEGKGKCKCLFAPELGGSYEVFNKRPLPEEIALYCTQDVKLMPKLWKLYFDRLSPAWAKRVEIATGQNRLCHIRRGTMEKDRTGL